MAQHEKVIIVKTRILSAVRKCQVLFFPQVSMTSLLSNGNTEGTGKLNFFSSAQPVIKYLMNNIVTIHSAHFTNRLLKF